MSIKSNSSIFHREASLENPKSFHSWFIGRPLRTADAPHQTIGKLVGLAVFASDALSSTAYATQEILMILAVAGAGAYHIAFPISIAIVILMAIVAISYEQTIHAYPGGGGAYIVSRDNLGDFPAQSAAAALLMDYILTVAVSVSSGVAQIMSAFPLLYPYRVWVAVFLVMVVMTINLRGVKESGVTFAIPTYFFVFTMLLTVIVGIIRYLSGSLGVVQSPPELILETTIQVVTPFLILHAFSSGTAALTGIEAISNGITAFKEPRSRNAGITLIWMASILATLFLGVSFLATRINVVPSEMETVISQISRTVFGGQGLFYLLMIAGTAIILVMAANTAFADFPRLSALLALDGYVPRQLAYRGSRLVYSRGIITLAVIASLLIVLFQASVSRLIPLYAIGVFLSFTLSQSGMAHRWWKSGRLKDGESKKEKGSLLIRDRLWLIKMLVNGFGAVCTLVVMIVFVVTKFLDGAWLVVILLPVFIFGFSTIHRHYKSLAGQLSLSSKKTHKPTIKRNRVIIPISGVHQGTLDALRYARTLTADITAVHVSLDPDEEERIIEKWKQWGDGLRLVVIDSPFRLFHEPLLEYIGLLQDKAQPGEIMTILVPQFVPKHNWTNMLHSRTAETMRRLLLQRDDIVVIEVPYLVS